MTMLKYLLIFLTATVQSQSLQRQCFGSGSLHETIGQPYSTSTYYDSDISFRPGFQQPIFKIDKVAYSTIKVEIFPNPVTYSVMISLKDTLKDCIFRVMNVSGENIIFQRKNNLKELRFNCSDWPIGIYFISISDGDRNKHLSKLIKL